MGQQDKQNILGRFLKNFQQGIGRRPVHFISAVNDRNTPPAIKRSFGEKILQIPHIINDDLHQAVITVMDAARQLGFVHLNFATTRSNDE